MPRPKVSRVPATKKRRKATTNGKYKDWLGRPVTKAQYDRLKKQGKVS